ncbi:hypothetical protein RFI_06448 [Reticulomyxa filosa]|uniref:EF-hand domain-containing protein n=1 Tax=Reticulomyxa filosa TaxID=46433 RepID=X6NXD7_RETFI|nr:hypothetical protein RFI_06448 [Reticulomyxa filosa]|eukprot:ETO30671.1 hypothetical protein RFI_06448 [Reticulomyxa filosa]
MSQSASTEAIYNNRSGASSVALISSLIAAETSLNGVTEENARKLFDLYTIEEYSEQLQPPDVRKLLFDTMEAFDWPLVVPDEALDAVFEEMSLNEKSGITWVEFKSFLVFLQEKPFHKLLQLITQGFSKEELSVARSVAMDPIQPVENPSFERSPFQQAAEKILGDKTTQVYVYFLGGGSVLALGIGDFETTLAETKVEDAEIGGTLYRVKTQSFDSEKDMFPPIQRAGGFSSKVARKLADSYVVTKQWDQQHLKIGQRTANLTKLAKQKWQTFDAKFKVQQKVDNATKTTVDAVKAFNEKHQISRKLSETAKNLDEKFDITAKVDKIKSSEKVQKVSNKVSQLLETFDQISKETKQVWHYICLWLFVFFILVNEKEAEYYQTEEHKEDDKEQSNETNDNESEKTTHEISSSTNGYGEKTEDAIVNEVEI